MEQSLLRSPPYARAVVPAIGALGVSNLVTNLWLPQSLYVPWNLGMTTGMIVVARSAGCDALDMGFDRRHLPHSLRAGAVGAGIVAAGYGMILLTGVARDVFRDERATAISTGTARWHLFVRIPLGTVVAEEITFRGALPALFASSALPAWLPGTLSSLLFGLWHVLPSLQLARANVAVGRFIEKRTSGRGIALAVGITALAGFAFHRLRQRTGHVAAPILVHLATNELGFLAARLIGNSASLVEPDA